MFSVCIGRRSDRRLPSYRRVGRSAVLLLSLLLMLLIVPASGSCAERLAWRLKPGQQLRVRLSQTTRTEMQVGETSRTLSVLAAMELRWKVERVDDQRVSHIDQAFTRLILRSTGADGRSASYDSSSPATASPELRGVAAAMQTLLASRVTVAIDPRGEILAVRPAAETESLLREVPAFAPWKRLLSPAGMNRVLGQALGRLPEGPVEAGDTWQVREEVDSARGAIEIVSTYRYEGAAAGGDPPRHLIRVSTTFRVIDGEGAAAAAPGAFDQPARREQSGEGTLQFDSAAGHVIRSRITRSILSHQSENGLVLRVSVASTLATEIVALDEPQ